MSTPKPRILLLGTIVHAHDALQSLGTVAELLVPKSTDHDSFVAECASGAFDGAIAMFRTFGSISITGFIDAPLLDALPSSIKFICHNGAGYDQISIAACTEHGISVSNTPTAVDDATADVNLFLLIGALRGFNAGLVGLRRGQWNKKATLGHDPQGKVLGILGMGGIGRALVKRVEPLGMTVIYHNRSRLPVEEEQGARYVSFDELLAESDVISLNLPLNKNTRHIISKSEFAKMKDGVVILNTARGGVMNEDELVVALDSGKVRSVGLDVYEDEPNVHPGLVANENVLLLPHMGTFTFESQLKMEVWALDNVRQAVEKGTLKSIVPEQKGVKI